MSKYLSERLAALTPYTPGEQPQDQQYIKLNTNESPYLPSPAVVAAVSEHEVEKLRLYSDPACTDLLKTAAAHFGLQPDQIMPGNGSDENLFFALRAFCDETHPLAYADITYGCYSVWCGLMHIPSHIIPLKEDFTLDPADYYGLNETIVIANPNAPTGLALPCSAIEEILKSNPNNVVIVDEAYVDFGGESCVPLINNYENQFQWSLSVNATHNRNVIKKLSNELKEMNRKNQENRNEILPIYEEGESTTVIKSVRSLGIDPATGQELFQKLNGEKTFVWDAADKVPVGDTEPKVRGAVNSSLIWKNLSVNLGFSYQFGADRYNQTLVDKIENIDISQNVDRRAAGSDRWSPTNRYAKYKGISFFNQQTPVSTRFLQKLNEFVFNSVSIGYRFEPKQFKFLEACKIASLSLNASMQDIGRISSVKQERGLDYPFARSFNLSLSVLFN